MTAETAETDWNVIACGAFRHRLGNPQLIRSTSSANSRLTPPRSVSWITCRCRTDTDRSGRRGVPRFELSAAKTRDPDRGWFPGIALQAVPPEWIDPGLETNFSTVERCQRFRSDGSIPATAFRKLTVISLTSLCSHRPNCPPASHGERRRPIPSPRGSQSYDPARRSPRSGVGSSRPPVEAGW